MTALLLRALRPNLVQTLEGSPALIHGGPFANIAHGCNSIVATRAALRLADYVVTEAGFGADLGAEKFFDIKCRQAGLKPAAAVVVATARALKMNGGVAKSDLARENLAALEKGLANLERHVANVQKFGVEVLVAINRFGTDTEAELALIKRVAREKCGVEAVVNDAWSQGAAGAEALARAVVRLADASKGAFHPLYPDAMPLIEKTRTIAREIYGASDISADASVRRALRGTGERGLWPPADLRRQDAIFVQRRPDRARRADRPRRADHRGARTRRGGICRGDDGRDRHHARLAARAGGRGDSGRERKDRGVVLGVGTGALPIAGGKQRPFAIWVRQRRGISSIHRRGFGGSIAR